MQFGFENLDDNYQILLKTFFKQLFKGFDRVCLENGRWNNSTVTFIPGAQDYLRKTWLNLRDETEERERVLAAIDDAENEARFASAGLTGIALAGKLHILSHWSDAAFAGLFDPIKRLLAVINSILGSFVQASGLGEAFKELKEMIENALRD